MTCYHAAGKGEIWKLDPPERRNSKNYTCPNGFRHVGGRPAEQWLLNELILTGLEAANAISHEFLMRAQGDDGVCSVAWMQNKLPWCLIELLVVIKLAKGFAGSKRCSFLVRWMEGLRAEWPFATLILIAVMYSLPSAAAAVAMETKF